MLRLLLTTVVLALIAAAVGYFVWGARLEAEYEARVATLPVMPKPEPVKPEDNMAGPLLEAAAMLKALQAGDEELMAVVFEFTVGDLGDEHYEEHGYVREEEDLVRLQDNWPKLDPYFAKLEEAAARPVFLPPCVTRLNGPPPFAGVQEHTEMLALRTKVAPASAPASIQLLLDIADRWRVDSALPLLISHTVRSSALEILHRGLREGTIDVEPRRAPWVALLARTDAVKDLQAALLLARSEMVVLYYEKLRRGEDPYAEARALFAEMEKAPHLELPDVPWFASWYGRPVLHLKALEALHRRQWGIAHATSEESIRRATTSAPDPTSSQDLKRFIDTLEHAAIIRLARIALGAPRDERDPFTGKPFLYEKRADRIVIASPLTKDEERLARVSERLSWEELLTWEIRVR